MSNRWFCHRTGGMRRICGGRASGWSSITPPDRKKREGWATRSFVVGEPDVECGFILSLQIRIRMITSPGDRSGDRIQKRSGEEQE